MASQLADEVSVPQPPADQVPEQPSVDSIEPKGVKRPAEDEPENHDDAVDDDNEAAAEDNGEQAAAGDEANDQPLSKNKLRKLKRQKLWEEKKADKRLIRKEKRHAKQERKREAKQAEIAAAIREGKDPAVVVVNQNKPPAKQPSTRVPITVVLDCQYEKYMFDKELVSMASQLTRCYSDNRKARYRTNFVVSSFGGEMRERFEKALSNQYKNWKGVHFVKDDFVTAAHKANEYTAGPDGGEVIPTLQKPTIEDGENQESISIAKPPPPDSKKKAKQALHAPEPELETADVDKSIVYLTADSPYTLDRLEPNTSYVIGGIIDRNREKGLCYKVARERNVRTAKLPIGELMVLQSRHVLATNHVMEIMLKYLELGDWGAAFMQVIPTRKGGRLRDEEEDHLGEVPQAPGGAAATEDEGNLADTEQEPPAEQKGKPADDASAKPVAQSIEQEPAVEVEGDNSDAGLEKNSLNQQRWSAPPVEFEEVADPADASSKNAAAP